MTRALIAQIAVLQEWSQLADRVAGLTRTVADYLEAHQTVGLFLVIFAEELGIPLPAPGDVVIAYAGVQTTRGTINHGMAYVAVVGGAVTGSFCLYGVSRRFGHPFLFRFGRYVGLYPERLERAERAFQRWGPWAVIVGRHIPGMRVVLSAFAGAFEIRAPIFVACVLVSATIWATIFIELGRVLGRRALHLIELIPSYLLPAVVLGIVLVWLAWFSYEHVLKPRRAHAGGRRGERGGSGS